MGVWGPWVPVSRVRLQLQQVFRKPQLACPTLGLWTCTPLSLASSDSGTQNRKLRPGGAEWGGAYVSFSCPRQGQQVCTVCPPGRSTIQLQAPGPGLRAPPTARPTREPHPHWALLPFGTCGPSQTEALGQHAH